ncbi:MAG: DNA polymerase III subunit gamma/tau [Candidatus Adiutrix sp.]|jgi:DNA polymerase-3 subunit gamma/tau|nr:DNA polymerase III subunit gamma/tau [Candidatus Adiutrix sp.]
MSYLVLARKYRPRTFADLVGQEQVSRTLQNALTTGRVAHAYLFSGPRGVGKTTAARLLAMALSCEEETAARRPCGDCGSCLEIQNGQAVDVIEVDGASNRGINEIRDLRETVKYLPAKSRYKVYIIDEVHALTKDAFNALLKTLEEPPPHVVFIFATTETHKVLPTILSRCQRYDFRRIRVEDIAARLAQVAKMENIQAEPAALELIARQAEGGLRDSLSLMDQAIASGGGELSAEEVRRSLGLIDQALVRRAALGALGGQAAEALSAVNEAYLRGYDFKDLGLRILEYIRGLTLVRVDPKNIPLMNLTETEEREFAAEAGRHSLETLHRHFEAWLKFQNDLSRNPQPRWLLEAQVIRMAQLAPLTPMMELMERLGRLLAVNPPPRPAAPPARGRAAPAASGDLSGGRAVPERAASSGEGGPPADWGDFMRRFGEQLDDGAKNMLSGAQAVSFGPALVSLTLPSSVGLGNIVRKSLEAKLLPLLQSAFGRPPELELTRKEDYADNQDLLNDRLAAFKSTPEALALMKALPGEFVDFLPGAEEAAGQADEMEEAGEPDEAEGPPETEDED